MKKYFFLSDKEDVLPVYKGEQVLYADRVNLLPVSGDEFSEDWLNAGDGCSFKISNLQNIMYCWNKFGVECSKQLFIYEVNLKPREELLDDEAGHHDVVSNISFYEGKLVRNIKLKKRYDLSRKKDLDALIKLGFFEDEAGSLFRGKNLRLYYEWLIRTDNQTIFQYLYSKEPDFSHLGDIVRYNKPELLRYILKEDIELDDFSIELEIKHALEFSAENSFSEMFLMLLPFVSDKTEFLYSGTCSAIDTNDIPLVDMYLDILIRENDRRGLLAVVNYVTPKEKLHFLRHVSSNVFNSINPDEWDELIVLALACESDELLEQLMVEPNRNMKKIVELTKRTESYIEENEVTLKDFAEQGNIIACQYILKKASQPDAKYTVLISKGELDSALLVAAEHGFLGIVKLLITNGAEVTTWMNYSMKFANKYNYSAMKEYLLEMGAPDEVFA